MIQIQNCLKKIVFQVKVIISELLQKEKSFNNYELTV